MYHPKLTQQFNSLIGGADALFNTRTSEKTDKIWFTFTDGTDNYHSWRWGNWGKKLWDHFPAEYAYSYNRGRSWDDDDLETKIYRPNCILCVFNIDLLPFDDGTRGKVKQNELVDPNLLKHWQ